MIDDATDGLARARPPSRGCAPDPSNKDSPSSHSLGTGESEIGFVEVDTAVLRQARRRQNSRFLKGPVPMRDIAAAARLPGKALAVFIAARHRADLTRSTAVKLPASLMRELGVGKDAKARALRQLETAGLVAVRREPGHSPIIKLRSTSNQ